jgi:hypothetical protein
MSGKNDRIILAGMIALGVVVIAVIGAIAGIGTYIYFGEPGTSPTPVPAPSPAPTSTPVPTASPSEAHNPFDMGSLVSDRGSRTYTLQIDLADGAAPVNMTKVTAEIVADNQTYPAWDYRHAEHSWSMGSNGDALLEPWETFKMIVYTPQAGLPLTASSPVKLILLIDSVPVFSINVTAV